MTQSNGKYYRKGLGLKAEVRPELDQAYGSRFVRLMKECGFELQVDRIRFRMAKSLGFCYGVDRAVEYAYEACRKFPDRRIFLVGEIIHNPVVNRQLADTGVTFLYPDQAGRFDFGEVTPQDVVIIPAFGVPLDDFEHLREKGCVLVDTTCGSVLNVWKRVESYARDGFTAIVHGKHHHEETRATSSQVLRHPEGRFLVVRDMAEADLVCDYIRGGIDRETLMERVGDRCSEGFDPDRHLERVGVANQTTMLASESLAIAARLGEAMADRYGEEGLPEHFRSFDTICSATQDRQDAVAAMMTDPPDIMIVVGGYNSSNTNNLAHLCARSTRTFHIETAVCIDPHRGTISHKVVDNGEIVEESGWLPDRELEIGLTAGASTPDSLIGRTVERILLMAGLDPEEILAAATTA
jgi:4-hydroxy-3-methylbut-2-enyl diphosphate reductase